MIFHSVALAKAAFDPGRRDEQGQLLLPNARLVLNHFHLVKLANDCVTKVRRR